MAFHNVTFKTPFPKGPWEEERKIRWVGRALEEMKSDLLREGTCRRVCSKYIPFVLCFCFNSSNSQDKIAN